MTAGQMVAHRVLSSEPLDCPTVVGVVVIVQARAHTVHTRDNLQSQQQQ
jgi:hypothetical protein